MTQSGIVVVKLSESFSDVWTRLAEQLGAELRVFGPTEPATAAGSVAAMVLAAGGSEGEVAAWLRANQVAPEIPVFAVGSDPGRRTGIKLVARGAADYFALPDDLELLRNALEAATERRREADRRTEEAEQRVRPEAFAAIIGDSPALKETLSRAARILDHPDTTALIIGETGTGKELLVRALHDGGPRRTAPFVAVNCSALPQHLVESEMFGHEKGAFTDAHAAKPGLFEIADGGTLFLDELGTLPLEVQAKLLRVLEDGEVRRVGATKPHRVDVRVIAATNEELDQAVADGSFRRDLYFRLCVITLTLPPLRERGDDVIVIARALLAAMAARHQKPVPKITPEMSRALMGYPWPGNVRELKNSLERALLLSTDDRLDVSELLPRKRSPTPSAGGPLPFPATLDDISTAAAQATVELCGGNRSEAARRLGISRQRLRRLLP